MQEGKGLSWYYIAKGEKNILAKFKANYAISNHMAGSLLGVDHVLIKEWVDKDSTPAIANDLIIRVDKVAQHITSGLGSTQESNASQIGVHRAELQERELDILSKSWLKRLIFLIAPNRPIL